MLFKHKFLKLNLGLVKENFTIVKKEDRELWEKRGFKIIKKYPIFHYKPNSSEVIMLGVPLNIEQFGIEKFNGSKVVDFSNACGTYGMGGPGFFGLKLHGEYGTRWLIYCIWFASEHILYDDRILECHPNYSEKYNPVVSFDNHKSDFDALKEQLVNMTVEEVLLSKDSFEVKLVDSASQCHTIRSYKFSDKFPEQAGAEQKRNSFDVGEMKDYLLVTYDGTNLKV